MKKWLLLLLCFVLAVSLLGCMYKSYIGRTPCDQPNTVWVSEDKRITVKIDDQNHGTGVLVTEGGEIEFIFISAGPTIYLYKPEAKDRLGLYPEEQYERWVGSFRYYDRFTATVEETTFFEVGDKITFYRVDS